MSADQGTVIAPVSSYLPPQSSRGESTALVGAEANAKAMVFIAAELAMRNPRNEQDAIARIARVCKIPAFAEKARYRFPRGWKRDDRGNFVKDANGQRVRNFIEGPAVGLARTIATAWGNIRYGNEIVSSLGNRRRIQGWAWDLESNVYVTVPDEFALEIQRKNEAGETEWVDADEREGRELLGKRTAICERNAILKLVPVYVVSEAEEHCKATMHADAATRLKSDRLGMVKAARQAWAQRDVTVTMLERFLGHKLDELSAEELVELRKMWVSIEDGNSTVASYFTDDPAPPEAKPEGVASVFDAVPATPQPTEKKK